MDSTKRATIRLENLQFRALLYRLVVNLEKSLVVDPSLVFLESIDSTNLELARLLSTSVKPDLFAVLAAEQIAGRGRLERSWVSEPGKSISLSVLLKPTEIVEQGLVPLFVGSCVARALSTITSKEAGVKWPNDVQIDGRKICGVLSELTDQGVIAGIGVNLDSQQGAPETACAVSDFAGADFDEVSAMVLAELRAGWLRWLSEGNDYALGLIRSTSVTIGMRVRAIMPSEEEVVGTAVSIESDGRLRIEGSETHLVSAADVWHLRN